MTTRQKNFNTYIVWEGLSSFDLTPLVLLLTLHSQNKKTGNMLQTYILRQDILPSSAQKTGLDSATCGNCPHRPITAKNNPNHAVCYVNTAYSVNAVWELYTKDKLPYLHNYDLIRGRYLRIGTYGDPAMIPLEVWQKLLDVCSGHTGYTSQWMEQFALPFQGILMASCNNLKAKQKAESLGWKTYTNLPIGSLPPDNAQQCPYSTDSNNTVSCLTCRLCNGKTKSIWIEDHGLPYRVRVCESSKQLQPV